MIRGMELVLNAFKNDEPFLVSVVTTDGKLIFEGNFYDLYTLNYSGYKVSDDVSLNVETRFLTVKVEPFNYIEVEIRELKKRIKYLEGLLEN